MSFIPRIVPSLHVFRSSSTGNHSEALHQVFRSMIRVLWFIDESVIALANGCHRLRSLGLYYCQNITDRAMYSLANSRVKSKHCSWASIHGTSTDEDGLMNLNISQCTALTPPAVQAVCDSFPALHTCPERHSLIISGCLSLTAVHCPCAVLNHRPGRAGLSH